MLAMDEGAAQIGEFSLTDRRFSKITKFMADILYDENFGGKYGNCHVAVGASYADTYTGDVSRLDEKLKKKLYADNYVEIQQELVDLFVDTKGIFEITAKSSQI